MTQENLTPIKSRLLEYLSHIGHAPNSSNMIRCPFHDDQNPSASIKDDRLHCFVCQESWDIFDIYGKLNGETNFIEIVKAVKKILNISDIDYTPSIKKQRIETEPAKARTVTYEDAKKIYTRERFNELADFNRKQKDKPDWGSFLECDPYYDENGMIDLVDVRYVNDSGKKTVISCWYNGYTVKATGSPLKIFNRHLLKENPDKPFVWVEGAKCARIAGKNISGFIFTTMNRFTGSVKRGDYTPIGDRHGYIIPDDDHKIDEKTGKEFPLYQQPGMKAARILQQKLKEQLNIDAKIVPPIPDARNIKLDGADIVEWLEVRTPEEIARYIVESDPVIFPCDPEDAPPPKILTREEIDETENSDNKLPFEILGIGNDNHIYAIDYAGKIQNFSSRSFTNNDLLNIGQLSFWISNSMCRGGNSMTRAAWEEMHDWVLQIAKSKDFNTENILGRGAWKNEKDGSFYFWDGRKGYGIPDPAKRYDRKDSIDIGLDSEPASKQLCHHIISTINSMTFKTPIDAMRLASWCALAPFTGVLPIRPPVFITGGTGTGKTTVIDYVVKNLAIPYIKDAEQSTPIGLVQKNKNDTGGWVLDEADVDQKKRNAYWGLMRSSMSDSSPDGCKGTSDHRGIDLKMKAMFMYSAIDPVIEDAQNENRIFTIEMIDAEKKNEMNRKAGLPVHDFSKIRENIFKYITPENGKRIRSLTWNRLHEIIELADRLSFIIQDYLKAFKIGLRRAHAEALLLSAYYLVWLNKQTVDLNEITEIMHRMYERKPIEEQRNSAEELVDKILDRQIRIEMYKNQLTFREILQMLASGKFDPDDPASAPLEKKEERELSKIAARNGLRLWENSTIAIQKKNIEMMGAMGKGYKWWKELERHKGFVQCLGVSMAGATKGCVIISGILDDVPF